MALQFDDRPRAFTQMLANASSIAQQAAARNMAEYPQLVMQGAQQRNQMRMAAAQEIARMRMQKAAQQQQAMQQATQLTMAALNEQADRQAALQRAQASEAGAMERARMASESQKYTVDQNVRLYEEGLKGQTGATGNAPIDQFKKAIDIGQAKSAAALIDQNNQLQGRTDQASKTQIAQNENVLKHMIYQRATSGDEEDKVAADQIAKSIGTTAEDVVNERRRAEIDLAFQEQAANDQSQRIQQFFNAPANMMSLISRLHDMFYGSPATPPAMVPVATSQPTSQPTIQDHLNALKWLSTTQNLQALRGPIPPVGPIDPRVAAQMLAQSLASQPTSRPSMIGGNGLGDY